MIRRKRTKKTSDSLAILEAITGNDPELRAHIAEEVTHLKIASAIGELRRKAGLSQAELARRISASPSAISRLEAAEYEGDFLPMLQRIATALDNRLEVRSVPSRKKLQPA